MKRTNLVRFTSLANDHQATFSASLSVLAAILLLGLLAPVIHAQTFSVIHTFTGGQDGALPPAGVILKGNAIYGTTWYGTLNGQGEGYGTVYQITHNGSLWITTPIYLFLGSGDAHYPNAGVMFGSDGYLYGTTMFGGANDNGAVYSLVPQSGICRTANCFWTEHSLYSFSGLDGTWPVTALTWDQAGNLYGTTLAAGFFQGGTYSGNVFQLQPSGNGWTGSSLYLFSSSAPDGRSPYGGVIFDKDGNLWGTTSQGGANGNGAIFELKYAVGVGWQETRVHDFQANDGINPTAALVADAQGNFYGATSDGGSGGGGTIFELSPSGNSWTYTVLYSFASTLHNNCGPQQALTFDSLGNLYGTTRCDGSNQLGNVFKLTKTGNGWAYSSLYDFTGGSDGSHPMSNVTIDSDGTLYGTASDGGGFLNVCTGAYKGCGTVWMIKP